MKLSKTARRFLLIISLIVIAAFGIEAAAEVGHALLATGRESNQKVDACTQRGGVMIPETFMCIDKKAVINTN